MKINKLLFTGFVLLFLAKSIVAQESYSLEKYRTAVLNYNQQVKVSKESTLASVANEKSSKSAFLPRLELQGEAAVDLANLDLFQAPKGSYHPYNYNAVLTLRVPVLSFGERTQIKNAGQSAVNISKLQQDLVADKVSQEINAAWTKVSQSQIQIEVATESMENANQSLELNTYSYNEGKISLIDVLQAQISWIQAYGNKIGAFLNYQLSNAE